MIQHIIYLAVVSLFLIGTLAFMGVIVHMFTNKGEEYDD
jgi:hypothetical protein